jgi:hypothetical protein
MGAVNLPAAANTEVGTAVPAGKLATTSISVCNRTAATIKVRLALVDGALGDLAAEDYLLYDSDVAPGKPVVFSRIPMSGGETVVAWAGAVGLTVQRRAFEEDV